MIKGPAVLFCDEAAGALAIIGTALGLVGGHFASGILIHANTRTYDVSGPIKGLSPLSLAIGFGVTAVVFCIAALFCYGFVGGQGGG